MQTNKLLSLINELNEKKLWGSVKLIFQEGEVVHIEINQSIKIEHKKIFVVGIPKELITIKEV